MSVPRVVHISPWPPTDRRLAELARIFGQPVEVIELSHLDLDPAALVQVICDAEPDAVVLATATPDHRQVIEALASEQPVLRPMFKRIRNARGEPEDRPAGVGLLRTAGRIEPRPRRGARPLTLRRQAKRKPNSVQGGDEFLVTAVVTYTGLNW